MTANNKLGKYRALLLILLIALLFIFYFQFKNNEQWPQVMVNNEYKALATEFQAEYVDKGFEYEPYSQEYKAFEDYLNWGNLSDYTETEKIKFDSKALPIVKYGDNFYYNPVTTAQFALASHGKFVEGDTPELSAFIDAADKLVDLQGEDGALRYNFNWRYYLTKEVYEPGWVSGMAQGHALSVYSRAYEITKDEKYLKAGSQALSFLITSKEDGGVMSNLSDLDPSLGKYLFFEEYLSTPNNYTLNGYMFALLGLYDWAQIQEKYDIPGTSAEEYFAKGIDTLINLLPYYDIGGFSAYDLGHLNFEKMPHVASQYHLVHLYLLDALHSITNEKIINDYSVLWKQYIDK